MGYKKYVNGKKFKIYDFEFFSLNEIGECFGDKKKYRIGKFLDKVYRSKIRSRSSEEGDWLLISGFVYVSIKDLEGILGIRYYKEVLEKLSKKGIISYRRDKNSKYDYNKKLWFVKLNDEFFSCVKNNVDIEDGLLNRFLERKNNEIINKESNNSNLKNKVDKFIEYEKECCKVCNIKIQQFEKVIDLRLNNKLEEFKDKVSWEWMSKIKRNNLEKTIENFDWGKEKRDKINDYNLINEDLINLKNGNIIEIGENVFFRDGYGKRLYNIFSRVIREFRKEIRIEGEEVVEIDLKSSHLSLLYMLISRINGIVNNDEDVKEFEIINDIKSKLLELNGGNFDEEYGLDFIKKFESIFKNDGVFWSEKNNIEFNDYYDLMRVSFGSDKYDVRSRNYYKELVIRVLFSDDRSKSGVRIGKDNIDEIEEKLFEKGGKKFLDDLRKIDLINLLGNKEGRISYKRYKNVSLVLMNLENEVMDMVRLRLMRNKIKYVSMFDGFIVKEKYGNEILRMCNDVLEGIDNSLRFVMKGEVKWEEVVERNKGFGERLNKVFGFNKNK